MGFRENAPSSRPPDSNRLDNLTHCINGHARAASRARFAAAPSTSHLIGQVAISRLIQSSNTIGNIAGFGKRRTDRRRTRPAGRWRAFRSTVRQNGADALELRFGDGLPRVLETVTPIVSIDIVRLAVRQQKQKSVCGGFVHQRRAGMTDRSACARVLFRFQCGDAPSDMVAVLLVERLIVRTIPTCGPLPENACTDMVRPSRRARYTPAAMPRVRHR